jgi:hypothetical protein
VRDIAGELSVDAVVQFLKLWSAVQGIDVGEGTDRFISKWTADGSFLSRTAYRTFFHDQTSLPGAAQVWHSFAPFKVQFHAWLALRRRCWTTDRLARCGLLTHALCKFCSAAGETLDHLSLQCPFARDVWTSACQQVGFSITAPTVQITLPEWWPSVVGHLSRVDSKKANSFIMLTVRSLWLERNARVFHNAQKVARYIVNEIAKKWVLWLQCRWRGGRIEEIG